MVFAILDIPFLPSQACFLLNYSYSLSLYSDYQDNMVEHCRLSKTENTVRDIHIKRKKSYMQMNDLVMANNAFLTYRYHDDTKRTNVHV